MRYRYHWTFKLLALILAMVSAAAIFVGCAGLILGDLGYYSGRRQSQLYDDVHMFCHQAASAVFDRFAWERSGIDPEFYERFYDWGADVDAIDSLEGEFFYTIRSELTGVVAQSNFSGDIEWDWYESHTLSTRLGQVTKMPLCDYYPTYNEFMEPAEGMVYADQEGKPLPALGEGIKSYEYYVVSDDENVNWDNTTRGYYYHEEAEGAEYTVFRMEYGAYDTYQVTIYMTADQVAKMLDVPIVDEFIPTLLERYSEQLVPMTILGLCVLLAALLWLALVAGKSPNREDVKPEGLNVIPLDIYLVLAFLAMLGVVALTAAGLDQMIWNSGWGNYDNSPERFFWDLALLLLSGGCGGLVIAMFTMACASQMKVGDNYWIKHSFMGLCWRHGKKFVLRTVRWCWRTAKRIVKWFLGLFTGIVTFCKRLSGLLPLTWQWLVASGCVWMLMFLCVTYSVNCYSFFSLFFGMCVTVLLVLYGAYCFGALRDAAKRMSEGHLEEKIDNKYLRGSFGEFSEHLNALGDTCIKAAKQQMKSERMKSELITNVSHDIKTPLTSIINYVDLLQKTEDEAERREYLEVLERQSQRLKKLIEDLMEMSRASSGNVAVEIVPTDVCEAVNQALGEFADTLESCNLQVMLEAPAEPVMASCDGKHLWRVLSNVLGNVVKYAMPGTRVYVDVARREQKVEISVKNISAQMLNISADELMERFVRGDSSRNTEGNGLGLNIAKSLMELQGGKLALVVDGDLFKVILSLNAV